MNAVGEPMNVRLLPLASIDGSKRIRPVNEGHAAMLADLIAAEGVRDPIEVRMPDAQGMHRLIAGGHRLRAAKLAGLEVIPALVLDVDDVDAELREVDENLFRLDLGPLELGRNLAIRKRLFQQKHPRAKRGGDRRSDQFADIAVWSRFTTEAAALMRRSERTMFAAVSRYEKLADVRDRLFGTPIAESGKDLDALTRVPVGDRPGVVDVLLQTGCSLEEACAEHYGQPRQAKEPAEAALASLLAAWRKAEKHEGVRETFLQQVGLTLKKGRGV